jgi:hypothetical protein
MLFKKNYLSKLKMDVNIGLSSILAMHKKRNQECFRF